MDHGAEIEAAMNRLLDSISLCSDGRLIIVSLAAEVGDSVKRHVLTHEDLKTASTPVSRPRTLSPASEIVLRGQSATSTSRQPTRSAARSTADHRERRVAPEGWPVRPLHRAEAADPVTLARPEAGDPLMNASQIAFPRPRASRGLGSPAKLGQRSAELGPADGVATRLNFLGNRARPRR